MPRPKGSKNKTKTVKATVDFAAQIAEKQADYPAATAWLNRIENAGDIMAVQMRRASLLARQGQLAQARALLRQQPWRGNVRELRNVLERAAAVCTGPVILPTHLPAEITRASAAPVGAAATTAPRSSTR